MGLICVFLTTLCLSNFAYAQFGGLHPNDTTTGTSLNKLAIISSGKVKLASTTDTTGILGVVVGGAGTSGNAQVAISGTANCIFDGATTSDDYVVASTTSAGECHDAGSDFPGSGQILGRVLSTNAGGGTYSMMVFGPEVRSPSLIIVGNCVSCTIAAGATRYLVFGAQASNANEVNMQVVVTRPGVLSNFYFTTGGVNGVGAGQSLTCRIRKNAASTSIQIVSNNGDAAQTYSDTTDTATVAAGDLINVQCVNSGGSASPAIRAFSLELSK